MIAARSIIAFLTISALVFGFQNCSKVAMNEVDFSDASLQAVSISDTSDIRDDSTSVGNSSPSSPSQSSGGGDGQATNDGKDKGHSCNDSSAQDGVQSVECELSSSNTKVVLAGSLAVGSNAQASRICMSENACLNLVNEYAVSHDCSLTPGAATSPSSNGVQCTKVFPGSKGTCKNAKALSDADVSALLAKLGK